MKIVHVVAVTPKLCGLYETTRELAAALRQAGQDAVMVDVHAGRGRRGEDRGVPYGPVEAGAIQQADVILSHSGLDGIDTYDKPIIHVQHGRPRSSFLSERNGGLPIYAYQLRWSRHAQSRAVVTFWTEHVLYLRHLWGAVPVYAVPACVDLEAWTPAGPGGYHFHGCKGERNLVITDPWRDDIDPYWALHAYLEWVRVSPDARKRTKLHLYGCTSTTQQRISTLLNLVEASGCLGEVLGWVDGLAHVYRAADLLLTSHTIATRSIREAMACGCPVQRATREGIHEEESAQFEAWLGANRDQMSAWRQAARVQAQEMFAPAATARRMQEICERVLAQERDRHGHRHHREEAGVIDDGGVASVAASRGW